jgi:hypothetical protein
MVDGQAQVSNSLVTEGAKVYARVERGAGAVTITQGVGGFTLASDAEMVSWLIV